MASSALPLHTDPWPDIVAAPEGAPAVTVRALDWPCCAAPSILHAWNALALHAVEPNPFHESWYLLPALRVLDTGESVRMLLFEAGDVLVGMLPVAQAPRYYGRRLPHLAGWTHPNCFLGAPLVAPSFERAIWRSLLDWADRQGGSALFLHLCGLPLDGPLYGALDDVLAEDPRPAGLVFREERALLAAGKTPEDYFTAALSGKKRKELRRQLSRLSDEGKVAFGRTTSAEGLDAWADHFLELEAAGWKGKAGSAVAQQAETEALFRQGLAGAAAQGRLERLSLTLDGRPIAMLANFITPPGAFSFKTTYDEAYARFSPGVLLQCENLLMLDREDIAWADSCAAQDHPMIDHIWRERRALGSVSIGIGGKLRRGLFDRLLRVELSRRPGAEEPAEGVFPAESRDTFSQAYPEIPHKLVHTLGAHPLFELEALAALAEALPEASIEYNAADQPIGVTGKPEPTGVPIGQTIREIGASGSWAVLKNIEQHPDYAALLANLLEELRPRIELRTGRMLKTQGYIFVTSPGGVTPYHFDPEHNILLQVRGQKVMTQFPAGDPRYAPDTTHESYHTGGARELHWSDDLADGGREFALGPGEALFVPVMAPHFVRNGAQPSVSLSITWRSEWSFAEADARALNAVLRRIGLNPRRPGRWPVSNRAKAYGWRVLRKLKAVR